MSASKLYEDKIARCSLLLEKHKPMLHQIEEISLAQTIALVIENQINHNLAPGFIRQISVPSIIHAIASLPHDIVSVQPFESLEDNGCYFLCRAGDPDSLDRYPITQKKETNVSVRDLQHPIPPNEVAVHCMELACCLTDEVVHEIINHIAKKAENRIFCQVNSADSILNSIKNASEQIKKRIKRSATFVILPVAVARLLKKQIASDYDFDSLPINIRRIGTLHNRWTVYINAYEQTNVIVGYRGVHAADSGVVFSPYVLFYEPMKDEKSGRHTIFKRYQITVTDPEYYANLELKASNKVDSIMFRA